MIKGNGFALRHIKMSDAKVLFECERDKEARKNFMSTPKNIKEVEVGIRKNILEYKKKWPSRENFAIEVDGKIVGSVGIRSLDGESLRKRGAVGIVSYMLHLKFRGRGFASKALKLITNYSFKKFKLKRITGRCRSFNKASARVLEKAGYKLEGTHRKEEYKNGRYYDNMYWARVK